MADITDPQVISFSNDYLRPLSEAVRNLAARLTDTAEEYSTNISGLLTAHAGGDALADGSPADGRNPVTKADIQTLLGNLNSLLAEVSQAGQSSNRAKFTVRPLSV